MFGKRARKAKKVKAPPIPDPRTGAPVAEVARDGSATSSQGLRELVASELDAACRDLAQTIVRTYEPEVIVGLVKGGVFAGEELAASLGCDFVALRLHARSRDHGFRVPVAETGMPPSVEGKRVLVVDDVPGTGASLRAAEDAAKEAGAVDVRSATLVVRSDGFRPDFAALETEDLVVFPWDYEPSTGAVGSAGDDSQR